MPLQQPTDDADGAQTENSSSSPPPQNRGVGGVGGDSSVRGRGEAGPVVVAVVADRHHCGSLRKTVNLH